MWLDWIFLLIATLFLTWGVGLEVVFLLSEEKGLHRLITQIHALAVIYIGLVFVYLAAS